MNTAVALKFPFWNPENTPRGFDNESYNLIKKFGSYPGSFLHIQPKTEVFQIKGLGVLSFYKSQQRFFKNRTIVFARPICSSENLHSLLEHFLKEHPEAIFIGIDLETAQTLQHFGYFFNQMGVEFNTDLTCFDINTHGAQYKKLRRYSKYADKGFSVVEKSFSQINFSEIEAIESSWKSGKKQDSELFLLTRPPTFADEPDVRNFFCYRGSQLVGYVIFDPIFKEGHVIGYTANILRSRLDITPTSFLDFTLVEAMHQFKRENLKIFSLGLSPLHGLSRYQNDSVLLRTLLKATYQWGNFLYSFKNVASHKSMYSGTQIPLFVASQNRNFIGDFVHVLKATGLL